MAKWSGIRHKLEKEYLAEALRGRITYFATTYKFSHDREGRAAILLDGKEILSGSYYNKFLRTYDKYNIMDETALNAGCFDQRCFYSAFEIFDNQSIEQSLESDNLLVKIFAILDRRTGKRRLVKMKEQMEKEPKIIQFFYSVRIGAEQIYPTYKNAESKMKPLKLNNLYK